MAPAVSIVVVAYRQRELLLESLRAAVAAGERVPGGAELIVVDNGGLDGLVREHFPAATVISPGANLGFAGAAQRGIETASGRWVALVNDDARLDPGALALMLEAGEGEDERIGSVAAQVRFAADPQRLNSAGIDVDSLGVATERFAGAPASAPATQLGGDVFGATACVALYRAAMLRELGGLDERFFAYLEDVDLAWRARAEGWRCVYEPRALAYHHGSASSGPDSALKYFLVGRNRVRLLARNASARQLLAGIAGILAYDLAYILFVALTDRTLAPLRGRLAGLRDWPRLRRETASLRREVNLSPFWRGWRAALRQHLAYRELGGGA